MDNLAATVEKVAREYHEFQRGLMRDFGLNEAQAAAIMARVSWWLEEKPTDLNSGDQP